MQTIFTIFIVITVVIFVYLRESIKFFGENIAYVNNPSEELQVLAVSQNPDNYNYIAFPTEKVKVFYKKLTGQIVGECWWEGV
jgi:hypothetical protein